MTESAQLAADRLLQIMQLEEENQKLKDKLEGLTIDFATVEALEQRDEWKSKYDAMKLHHDQAVTYANICDRRDASYKTLCDRMLFNISKMPLGKGVDEGLDEAVARTIKERDKLKQDALDAGAGYSALLTDERRKLACLGVRLSIINSHFTAIATALGWKLHHESDGGGGKVIPEQWINENDSLTAWDDNQLITYILGQIGGLQRAAGALYHLQNLLFHVPAISVKYNEEDETADWMGDVPIGYSIRSNGCLGLWTSVGPSLIEAIEEDKKRADKEANGEG